MASDSIWSKVGDQHSANALLDSTHGLHDTVALEGRWEGAEFVNREGQLELHGYGGLYLLIGSQFEDVCNLELRFKGVKKFIYDYELEPEPTILVDLRGVLARLGTWEILAEGLEYRQYVAS